MRNFWLKKEDVWEKEKGKSYLRGKRGVNSWIP
jgi:hypothetical protein